MPAFFRDRADAVVFGVDKDNMGVVLGQFLLRDLRETRNDNQIIGVGMMGGRAIDLDGARAAFAFEGVGLKAAAGGDIPDMDMLVGDDIGGLKEDRIHRDRAFIMKVRARDAGPVNLGFHDLTQHVILESMGVL